MTAANAYQPPEAQMMRMVVTMTMKMTIMMVMVMTMAMVVMMLSTILVTKFYLDTNEATGVRVAASDKID